MKEIAVCFYVEDHDPVEKENIDDTEERIAGVMPLRRQEGVRSRAWVPV